MWYVMQVMSGKEHEAKVFLETFATSDNEELFIPTYERKKKFQGIDKLCVSILFPGYVFLVTDDIEDFMQRLAHTRITRKIQSMIKVLDVGGTWVPISAAEEAYISSLCGVNHNMEMSVGYIAGDKVTVTAGPLMGMEGNLKDINRHKKIATLSLELMGRTMDVTVGLEIVARVESE